MPNSSLWLERIITWGFPTLLIPSLRFCQDKDKKPQIRKELFVREFTGYAIGSSIYFATLKAVDKFVNNTLKTPKSDKSILKTALNKMPANYKELIPVVTGVVGYCLWSGFLSPKVSKLVTNKSKKNPEELKVLNISTDTFIKSADKKPSFNNNFSIRNIKTQQTVQKKQLNNPNLNTQSPFLPFTNLNRGPSL